MAQFLHKCKVQAMIIDSLELHFISGDTAQLAKDLLDASRNVGPEEELKSIIHILERSRLGGFKNGYRFAVGMLESKGRDDAAPFLDSERQEVIKRYNDMLFPDGNGEDSK